MHPEGQDQRRDPAQLHADENRQAIVNPDDLNERRRAANEFDVTIAAQRNGAKRISLAMPAGSPIRSDRITEPTATFIVLGAP
jgi:hypothetical protein